MKSLIINEVTFMQKNLSILDLCCGKGGDIPGKWKKVKPSHYVGVDLSAASVEEAQRRY
jgi:ubiquinone/menaquinone biosynthesis C-methylase UbiE